MLLGGLIAYAFGLTLHQQYLLRRLDELSPRKHEATRVDALRVHPESAHPTGSAEHQNADHVNMDSLHFDAEQYSMALVSDLDIASHSPNKSFTWFSILQHAELLRDVDNDVWDVSWGTATILETHTATQNRSMELSELVQYNGRLLGMCDRTGILYKIDLSSGSAFPRWAIADGDGDEAKPFKGEWATVKRDKLWVGSPGVKWFDGSGVLIHRNPEWVKHMDSRGHIVNHDWGPVYAALRRAVGVTSSGYLWHEAVHWDSLNRLWIFLPRRWSKDSPAEARLDEQRGANFLLMASEDFRNITARSLGPLEPEWGFTSVRKVLGTFDTFVALKVREVKGEEMQTKLCVFDLHGRFLLDPSFVDVPGVNVKFEGIEFLGLPSMYRYLKDQGSDPSVSKAQCKERMQARIAASASTSLLKPMRVEMSARLTDE